MLNYTAEKHGNTNSKIGHHRLRTHETTNTHQNLLPGHDIVATTLLKKISLNLIFCCW